MKNRLEIARELLSDDGVIFISIDDNESAYLKVLMDEIFGKNNFETVIANVVKPEGRNYGNIVKAVDNIYIYLF
jgi:adenine-specific DNA-methyltransferase